MMIIIIITITTAIIIITITTAIAILLNSLSEVIN